MSLVSLRKARVQGNHFDNRVLKRESFPPQAAVHALHGGGHVHTVGTLPVHRLRRPEAPRVVRAHATRAADLHGVRVAAPTKCVVSLLEEKTNKSYTPATLFNKLHPPLTLGAGTTAAFELLLALGSFMGSESVPPLATLSFVSLSEW